MTNDSDTIEQVCADLRGHDLIPPPRGAWGMYADRIEKVYDHQRRSWDAAIVDQRAINRKLVDEMAAKDSEIAKLRAALKPVLKLEDNYGGHWPFASLAVDAVKEAQRIYKEVAK